VHRRSDEQRGYGKEWKRIRRLVRADACERCGVASDLTVDHVVPRSMGGSDDVSNLRTLCRSCHAVIGVKSTSRRAKPENYGRSRTTNTCAASLERARMSCHRYDT
jgi:5-methylcytosine-specific restriction endonuclease McrA